ncbi:ATP-binding protein [Paraburkholderia sprentiae]|uniref:ATP-binding protein n=1 Tax=Paraburkholderia sprentiae TaxID=948107 RepID=UPI003908942A
MAIGHERRHHYAENRRRELPIRRLLGQRLCVKTDLALNKPFKAWSEVFPNAACVVSLVDRLVLRAEVILIDGESYRVKDRASPAEQRASRRNAARQEKKP